MKIWWLVLAGVLAMTGCSSPGKQEKQSAAPPPASVASSNPTAKFIEVVGFRINEKKAGLLEIQFAAVNHSEADLGDIKLLINLRTTTAKPGEPALVSFTAKVPGLGPSELKQVSVDVPTKLRVYELPDWQFLKADFQIAEPQ